MKIRDQRMDFRRNKRKRTNEDCGEALKTRALQKRKLKKLQEEKERELLSKSVEALEKYKIPGGAHALLQSSRNIGQVECRKVKCGKAGFGVPCTDQASRTEDDDSACCESESELEIIQSRQDLDRKDQVQSTIVEKQVEKNTSISLHCSQGLVCGRRLDMNAGCAAVSLSENDISYTYDTSLRENTNILCTSSMNDDSESTNSMVHIGQDKIKESPKPNTSWENELADFPALSFLKDSKNRRHISRPREVVDARNDIPIVMMEQEIMEAINEHSTVIIRGETGCGKTTQVPQFLYEVGIGSSGCPLGSGIIGVTQPRCIAVTATAKRVAYELGLQLGEEVGFQYRYDKKIGESCSIKFMTDGILLREIQGDFYLKRYSVIILDEVHERSLCTETLIGMLSAIIGVRQKLYEDQQKKLRQGLSIVREKRIFPLKLVLMSATMPVEDFRKMFPDPPQVINVSSRQFKVSTQFSATTEGHYINEAYKKVLEIHKTLPHGGILVFLTGYREIEELCQKLRRHSRKLIKTSIGSCATEGREINSVEEINMKKEMEAFDSNGNSAFHQTDGFSYNDEDHCEIDEYELDSIYDAEIESELETIGDDRDSLCEDKPEVDGNVAQALGENLTIASLKASFEALARKSSSDTTSACREPISCTLDSCSNQSNHSRSLGTKGGVEDPGKLGSLRVLPLYSMLPAAAQRHVFEKVKEGERLVVVATNVAETSLTIPGIKYVVDTGKVKVKDYNFSNGMETYKVQWISKASAIQREGRAGRTGPGHCFRLYSSAVYDNEFLDCSEAEISIVPVDGVLLLMKAIKIPVSKFQFPTPPNGDTIDEAEDRLKLLKALDSNGEVTPLGKAMAYYPISPRQSKMLLTVIEILNMKQSYSRAKLVLAYAVAAAAALSVSNPFDSQFEDSHIKNFDSSQNGSYSAPVNSEYMDEQEILISRKKLKVSSENFHGSSSDALSRAYALRGYELSKSQMGFCKENALHPETMEEISKLRNQLLKLVFNPNGVSGGVK